MKIRKKTLASCLTALTLLNSMGFSSPTQEVHATEPEVTTTVDLKVKILSNYLNIWKTKSNVQIENVRFKVINIPEGYKLAGVGGGVNKVAGEENTYKFTSKELSSMIYYKKIPEQSMKQLMVLYGAPTEKLLRNCLLI